MDNFQRAMLWFASARLLASLAETRRFNLQHTEPQDTLAAAISITVSPTLDVSSVSIDADGTSLAITLSQSDIFGYEGFTLRSSTGTTPILTYAMTVGATITFGISEVYSDETFTLEYVPGDVGEDNGAYLEPFTNQAVTNNSTLTAMSAFADDFIDEDGTILDSHSPAPFDRWRAPYQGVTWAEEQAVDYVISNNMPEKEQAPDFSAVRTADGNSTVLSSRGTTTNFRFTFLFYAASGLVGEWLFCATDKDNFMSVRWAGGGDFRVYENTTGNVVNVGTGSPSTVAADRWHRVEIDVNNGSADIYLDQVLVFTGVDVSGQTGRKIGIRNFTTGRSISRYFRVTPLTTINRIYCDAETASTGTADGSLAEPWRTQAQIEAAVAGANSGDRICFASGHNNLVSGDIDQSGLDGVGLFCYGYESSEFHARFELLDDYAPGDFTASGVNGEYYLPGIGANTPLTVLEDAGSTGEWLRMDGNTAGNVNEPFWSEALTFTRSDGTSPVIPNVGSLEAGQWRVDSATGRLYIKPTGTFANNAYALCTNSGNGLITLRGSTDCEIFGLWGLGNPGGGQIRQFDGAENFFAHMCRGSHGKRLLTFGDGYLATVPDQHRSNNLRVLYCEGYYGDWKGVSTEGAAPIYEGVNDGIWFGVYNHDIAEHESAVADVEGLMLSPGSNRNQVYFCKSVRIGARNVTFAYSTGLYHPTGFINDGGNGNVFRNNWVWETRTGFTCSASEGQDVTSYEAVNNMIIDCGSKTDPNNASHNAAFYIRAREDRAQSGVYRKLSGCFIEFNSIINCKFGRDTYDEGILVAAANAATCTVTATFKNNLVEADDASERAISFFHTASNTGIYVDIDNNIWGMSGSSLTQPVKHQYPGGSMLINSWAAWQAPWTDKNYDTDPGFQQDTSSVWADPNLDSDYRPITGSSAIGLASTDLDDVDVDALMTARANDVVGALEDAPA